ncbi:YveK family protein [Fundicoccus culcitae]|uniref:Capsular polysaccharide biosynthesis protein CpsC n=1 Tax=Fundicoccus culcitae TaxID=2969821 RepID=A0ABY5PA36_9LACT|nr:Wzz/FepE/Etk N-terminal domain-containing protein [Fundicoccus culcitae]UUX35250.1 Wzz/FepE/Etk N-terminal domain-containing protein [Fundicoccus culcitae]
MEEEISILDIFGFLRKYSFTIIVSTLLGAVIMAVIAIFFIQPTYTSRAELLVNQRAQDEQQIAQADINTSIMLINTYRNIILADSTLSIVNEELGGQYSVGTLKNAMEVSQQQNSQTFVITAEMDSPNEAQQVVEKTIEVFGQQVQDAYEVSDPNIFVLSPASYNPNPVSPNISLLTLSGAFFGFIISVGILLINNALDTRIKSPSYVEELGLINLGGITDIPNANSIEFKLTSPTRTNKSRRKV